METESRHLTTGKTVSILVLVFLLILASIATIVHLSKIGDREDSEVELFQSSQQYETSLLKRKKFWAQWLTLFSFPRNFNLLNVKPIPFQKALNEDNRDYIQRLRILDGMKVLLSLYALVGNSYLFTYYSMVSDPVQANTFRQSYTFLLISGALFTTPCLFFIAGFLQTFSFVQTDDDKMFTFDNLKKYYVKRILRFEALVAFTLMFAMFIIPMIGGGPIWETY
jgi:hypothetical protein